MTEHNELFFQVKVNREGDGERLAPLIHAALLEFAAHNADGSWPHYKEYTAKNGVTIAWSFNTAGFDQ